MAHFKTDVLVIGSGAGAAPAAFKLARSGLKVTMLEKGDWCPHDELSEDELAQIYLEMYRPSEEVDPTVVKSKGETVASASRVGQSFYLVGGGTVRYSGTSWRFRPKDFKKLSSYHAIAGSSLVDWPISYEELDPYYTEAELEVGISGQAGVDPTEPKRSKDVLLPPLAGDNYQKRLTAAATSLGWKPFPIPLAIHSQQNDRTGASPCMQCGWCSGYPCKWQAKSSVDLVIYPRAQETGHFTLKPNSYATNILTGKNGKVSGVEYVDVKTGNKATIECRVLILAASAIQSARLMLHSKSDKHPEGLANSSGQLGRNLMFHIEAKASARFDDEYHQGLYKKVGIHDFYFPKEGDGFINHRSIQSGSKAPPISFALSRPGFGAPFMKDLKENFLHVQEVQCMVEDLPQADNRVVLSSEKKDPWGVPAPEVHHVYHEHDRAAAASAIVQVEKLLKAAGGKDIQLPKIHDNITGRYTWHIMGTARMGNDPKTSVLNKNCQAHDVPNLFVLDGSAFCTSAGVNPTLTMQALSCRAGDFIATAMKEGKV